MGRPTVVNNVETLAASRTSSSAAHDWFKGIGRTEQNKGPKLFCVTGHVDRPGVY